MNLSCHVRVLKADADPRTTEIRGGGSPFELDPWTDLVDRDRPVTDDEIGTEGTLASC